jgi:hypothetical protein
MNFPTFYPCRTPPKVPIPVFGTQRILNKLATFTIFHKMHTFPLCLPSCCFLRLKCPNFQKLYNVVYYISVHAYNVLWSYSSPLLFCYPPYFFTVLSVSYPVFIMRIMYFNHSHSPLLSHFTLPFYLFPLKQSLLYIQCSYFCFFLFFRSKFHIWKKMWHLSE